MDISLLIARRFSFKGGAAFARSVARLAVISAGLGAALLFCAFCVLAGFREAVSGRVVSLVGHITIQKIAAPGEGGGTVSTAAPFWRKAAGKKLPIIRGGQPYIYKAALAKTGQEAEGIVLKGVGPGFGGRFFKDNLMAGSFSDTATAEGAALQICLSARLAGKLNLWTDSTLTLFFLQDPPRIRRAHVTGIYQTGLEEFDDAIVLTGAKPLQALNDWPDSLYSGFELYTDKLDNLDAALQQTQAALTYDLAAIPVTRMHPQIFDWLSVIGRNVQVMMALICIVACFNTAGTMLIFTLEKMRSIGLLQALGATQAQIWRIFWLMGLRVAGRGLLWGNVAGALICAIQMATRLVKLDANNYYVDYVPIGWPWDNIVYMNIGLIGGIALALTIPAALASKTSPVAAMRG